MPFLSAFAICGSKGRLMRMSMRMQVKFQLSMSISTNTSLYPFPIISPFFGALDQRASFKLVARCLSLVKIAVTSSSASLEVDTASCINPFWYILVGFPQIWLLLLENPWQTIQHHGVSPVFFRQVIAAWIPRCNWRVERST